MTLTGSSFSRDDEGKHSEEGKSAVLSGWQFVDLGEESEWCSDV